MNAQTISLRTLGKVLGVSHSYLSQIRTGKRPLPDSLRERLEVIGAYHLLTTEGWEGRSPGAEGDQKHLRQEGVLRGDGTSQEVVEPRGLEPLTPCLQSRCSPS